MSEGGTRADLACPGDRPRPHLPGCPSLLQKRPLALVALTFGSASASAAEIFLTPSTTTVGVDVIATPLPASVWLLATGRLVPLLRAAPRKRA